jgi:multidrug efflux system membrane fusion protein
VRIIQVGRASARARLQSRPAHLPGAAAAVVLAATLLLAGCGKEPPAKTEAASLPAVPVQTVTVQPVDWPTTYEAVGTVRARNSAQMAARVMGYVRDMKVKAGDHVAAGQLLAVLDARDLESGVQQAAAGVVEAQSAIPEADNGIAAAKANLELVQVTYKRMKDLFGQKSISNQEFDEVSSKLKLAQANYEMAVARRKQLDARIAQAESAKHTAEITKGYAEIRAPFAGVVTEKKANTGDMAAPGMPLLTIEQAGAYQLEVPVEEARLGVIRAGQPVTVKLDAFAKTIPARVTEVIPAIDPASRSFVVKILLPSDPRLHSGLFGRAAFVLGSRQVIAVPRSSVVEVGQVRNVLVADNGIAHARLLSLGETHDGLVEVLSGVSAGDKIVNPRPSSVDDGSKIEVR